MTTTRRFVIGALTIASAGILVATTLTKNSRSTCCPGLPSVLTPPAAPVAESAPTVVKALPRVLDLGAGKCVPCKMMAPILEELKTEYAGRMNVEFIDVWENPDAGRAHQVRMIPTQIFYDATGKELFRHEGFLAKADILAKCRELGFALEETP